MTRIINLGGGQYNKEIRGTYIANQHTTSDKWGGTSDSNSGFDTDPTPQPQHRTRQPKQTPVNYFEHIGGTVIERNVVKGRFSDDDDDQPSGYRRRAR